MTDPAATKGTFSDFRIIKGRKMAQFVIEIPLEQADVALKILGGLPQPAEERWIAMARLDADATQTVLASEARDNTSNKREKRSFKDLPLSQQAALRCEDKAFWKFLGDEYRRCPSSADEAAKIIRRICEVTSRADFDGDAFAGARWAVIEQQFWEWQRGLK